MGRRRSVLREVGLFRTAPAAGSVVRGRRQFADIGHMRSPARHVNISSTCADPTKTGRELAP
jgi:hypothetical protein